uniref:Uncharacterized protein n=1 Tax=Neovison vison TaxID=452646 RepID=A0A8C7AET0_NEOVI
MLRGFGGCSRPLAHPRRAPAGRGCHLGETGPGAAPTPAVLLSSVMWARVGLELAFEPVLKAAKGKKKKMNGGEGRKVGGGRARGPEVELHKGRFAFPRGRQTALAACGSERRGLGGKETTAWNSPRSCQDSVLSGGAPQGARRQEASWRGPCARSAGSQRGAGYNCAGKTAFASR